jgi:hypothetical protein
MYALSAGLKIEVIAISAMRANAISLVLVSLLLLMRLRISGQAAQT